VIGTPDKRNIRKGLLGKPEGNKPLGIYRRLKDNIKGNLKQQGGRAWTEFVGLRLMKRAENHEDGIELLGSIKCRKFLE
jgi:hypothetical protein